MKPTKKRKRANSTPACACCATATRPKGVQDTAPLVASPLLGSSDHPKQAKQGKSRKRTAVQTPPLQRSVANGPNLPLSPQLDTVDDPLDLPVMTSSPPRDCDAELPFQQPHHQTAGAPQGSLLDTFAAPGQFSVPHQGLHNHMNISSDSDSDDNAQDMPHFLQAHSANLLPDREIPHVGSTHGQAPHHSSRSLAPLNQAVYTLLESSLAPSTKSSYQNALKHYHVFHHTFYAQTPLLPVSAERLAQFIAVCNSRGLQASTITSYISAISYVHKLHNMAVPADSFLIKKLLHSLRRNKCSDIRQPFSLAQLSALLTALKHVVSDHFTRTLLRAMFLLAFFGLFRVGEIAYSPKGSQNLVKREDVSFQCCNSMVSSFSIILKQYKHSQGRPSAVPFSRQPTRHLCPVHSLLRYLSLTSHTSGPLFVLRTGLPITTTYFRSILRACVLACHLDPQTYTAHSFRIGGATLASNNHMSACDIQKLGRWKSSAYKKYIRTPTLPLASSSQESVSIQPTYTLNSPPSLP
ncbi:uncharacterized protein LOC128209737 isoform X2 [Mya arenaria]|nr:uncharacterized protein LOC128209737 isoform X2 [Mya arenaria]